MNADSPYTEYTMTDSRTRETFCDCSSTASYNMLHEMFSNDDEPTVKLYLYASNAIEIIRPYNDRYTMSFASPYVNLRI